MLVSLVLPFSSAASLVKNTEYDHLIYKAWENYVPQTQCWHWLKAQYYQESLLKPDAKSHVGAMGIAQVMPGTWLDISKKLRFNARASPYDPELSIEAGAYYLNYQWSQWRAKRTFEDRISLAFAGYNAGLGNILKAQRLSGGRADWKSISEALPGVTGENSKETVQYVERIFRWKKQLDEHRSCVIY
ncbi:protein containing transglycosylase domain [Vibrio phage R01]|nr:protein containing transglycosylase domain [Vibrio phage R01]